MIVPTDASVDTSNASARRAHRPQVMSARFLTNASWDQDAWMDVVRSSDDSGQADLNPTTHWIGRSTEARTVMGLPRRPG